MKDEQLSLLQDIQNPEVSTSKIGQEGEFLARNFLERNGYTVAVSNFTAPIGRNRRGAVVNGEIDLIAYEGAVLCFVEVKTRTSEDFASPLSAVDLRKQRQIIRTAKKYLKIFHLAAARIRYDVVTAVLGKNKRPKIEIVKDYFNESKFKKSFEADYH